VTGVDLEAEVDLFGEQAVLCGGIGELVRTAFEVLVARGYPPELACLECVYQLQLTAGLLSERGIAGMYEAISRTALFGAMRSGPVVVGRESRRGMEKILDRIRTGAFAREWMEEVGKGSKTLAAFRKRAAAHPLERAAASLRTNLSTRARRPNARSTSPRTRRKQKV
jgi:ketol-acid reductoisomerase